MTFGEPSSADQPVGIHVSSFTFSPTTRLNPVEFAACSLTQFQIIPALAFAK